MNNTKNVLLPYDTFLRAYKLLSLLDDEYIPDNLKPLKEDVLNDFNNKITAITKRNTFTEYKTAEKGTTERENKRLKYLQTAKISKSFTSEKEVKLCQQSNKN